MSYWDNQKTRMQSSGSTIRDIQVNSTKESIINSFEDSPSYYLVDVYTSFIPLSSTPLDCWIMDNSDNKDLKNVIAYPDQILRYGDIIHWMEDDSRLLVLQTDCNGGIYYSGVAQKCLGSIKWIDEIKTIRESFFTYRINLSTDLGINDGKIIIQPDEQRFLYIQQNEYTLKIRKGQRFIFDNRAWRTTSLDTMITGLIYLGLKEDEVGVNDNVDLRVCDYYSNVRDYSLSILNGSSISAKPNSILQLDALVKDGSSVVSNPALSYSSSNTSVATVSSSGLVSMAASGDTVITVSLTSDNTVKDTISINVGSVSDVYTISISGDKECKTGQSKTYTGIIYKDGVIDSDKTVTWNLYDSDGVSNTTLATISSQSGTSATIKGNTDGDLGNVVLKATLDDDNTVTKTFDIQIKGLW